MEKRGRLRDEGLTLCKKFGILNAIIKRLFMDDKNKGKGGQPTSYKDVYCEQARKLCLLGYTDKDLADFFEVCEATINNWKTTHPEFLVSMKKGKDIADADIANSLYHRAKGYEQPEDKIFIDNGKPLIVPTSRHYPADPTAMIFWLKNRQPAKFRDRKDFEVNTTVREIVVTPPMLDDDED